MSLPLPTARFAGEPQNSAPENNWLVSAINGAGTGILLCDPSQADTPIVFANDAFCENSGYRREEILGRNCRFLQGRDTDPAIILEMRTAQAERLPFRGTLLNYRKDGTPFWNGLTINPVFDGSGNLVSFVSVQVDVTMPVENLEQVRRSEAQFALAQRVAGLGSWGQTFTAELEPATEKLTWSEETFRIFGHPPGAAINAWSLFENGVHPDDRAAVHSAYAAALRQGRAYSFDHRIVWPDDTEHVVHEEADFIFDEVTGRLRQVVGTVQDITERKRAALAAVHLAAIVASSEEAIISKTLEGIITTWNPAAEELYGYTEAEAIGQSCLRLLIPPDQLDEAASILHKLAHGEHVLPYETLRLRKGKEPVQVSLSISPIIDATGAVVAVSSISRDITGRKQAEEHRQAREDAERANLAKSAFLSRMSHELRTPLNAILGFGQLLELSQLNTRDMRSVQSILKGVHHLLSLVDEVLDLARVEAGELVMKASVVSFDVLAQDCIDLMAALAQASGISCTVEVCPACQVPILADHQRLRQVLLNLLSNAIKYNRAGGQVTLSCEQMSNDRARLSVRDTGPGISPESLARLFVPFERLGQESGKVDGIGLGLVVSKRFAEAMGGSLGGESELGRGSTFWIELPEATGTVATETMVAGPTGPLLAAPDELLGTMLLYIEDNPSNQEVVRLVVDCMRPHWCFLSAADGESGLQQARDCSPRLILLDLQLPGMNGDAVLIELRADPATCHIPVLLLSADATTESRDHLLALGADGYLAKPFKVAELLSKLDALLLAGSGANTSATDWRTKQA